MDNPHMQNVTFLVWLSGVDESGIPPVPLSLPFIPSALNSNDLAPADDTSHYAKTLPENPGFVFQIPTIVGTGEHRTPPSTRSSPKKCQETKTEAE